MSQFIRPSYMLELPSTPRRSVPCSAPSSAQRPGLLLLFALASLIGFTPGCQMLDRQSVITKLPPPPFRIKAAPAVAIRIPPSTDTPSSRRYLRAVPGTFETASPGFGWIPPRPSDRWKCIVVHHSATPDGSAADFDRLHRKKG